MKKGDFVKISYTGRMKETGELFDTTDEIVAKKEKAFSPRVSYEPQCIIVGEGRVIKGLDEELLSMKPGDEKTIELPPEKAFGVRSPSLIKLMPESEFRKNKMEAYPGLIINIGNLQGKVLSANSGRTRVDFNHPLAGRTLVYTLKVEAELETDEEKINGIANYYAHGSKLKIGDKIEVETKTELPERVRRMITDDINKHVKKLEVVFNSPKPAEKKSKSPEK